MSGQYLCLVSEVTEEIAKGIKGRYKFYKDYIDEERMCFTALESFKSLMIREKITGSFALLQKIK